MIRNALISSNSLFARSNSQLLKIVGVSAANHQKRDQKTMPVVDTEKPEKLPASAFGWYVKRYSEDQFSHLNLKILIGNNQIGAIGQLRDSTTFSIGDERDQFGHSPSVWLVVP